MAVTASGHGNHPQPQAHLVFQGMNHTRTGLCLRMAAPSVEVGVRLSQHGGHSHRTLAVILRAHIY